jgi:hypothetical protein
MSLLYGIDRWRVKRMQMRNELALWNRQMEGEAYADEK